MYLTVDIGNSTISSGIFKDNTLKSAWSQPSNKVEILHHFYSYLVEHLLQHRLSPYDINHCILSSVHPENTPIVIQILEEHNIHYTLFNRAKFSKLPIHIPNIQEIGADIVANTLGAHQHYRGDKVIIDFGTALTITGLSKEDTLLGVNICPGINTSITALTGATQLLHEVPIELPKNALGDTTTTAIQNGIVKGYIGMIKNALKDIEAEYHSNFQCILTGGQCQIMAPLLGLPCIIDRYLPLKGLHCFALQLDSQ